MFSIKNNILYFIVFNLLVQIQSLVEIPSRDDNDIAITEAAVRHTVNSIFYSLKLKREKYKARFKEFAAIHNFFATVTIQDHDNLKEISRLAKVDNIDNETQVFITQVNEVLNEDNKSHEATDDVTTYIETFIKKLEYLKHKYGFTNNAGGYDINIEIIKLLRPVNILLKKVAKGDNKTNDSEENLLSDNEFWKPDGRRIYDGKRTNIKRYPFMASVQFFRKFQCGGSIIKSDLVITSASCLQLAWNNRFFRENPSFLSVQVGSDFYEGGDENIAIQEVYFHPAYDPKNLRNNIAIMRLTRRLKFEKKVKRVKKIDFDRNPWPLPTNTPPITVIGWGARSASNMISDPWSNRLSYANLDFYPLSECREIYSKEYVTFTNFCAGFFSKGGGACNRDAGGPGVSQGILVGVISFGSPNCGTPDAPTVFTKLGYYAKWIEDIMEQDVPTSNARTTARPKKFTFTFSPKDKLTTTTKLGIEPIIAITTSTEVLTQGIPIREVDAQRQLNKQAIFRSTNVPKKAPMRDTDHLRKLNAKNLFEEFIATMFTSEEVREYLEQYESEIEKSAEDKAAAAVNEVTRAYGRPTTVSTTNANIEIKIPARDIDKDGSTEQGRTGNMVFTTESFESSGEESTVPVFTQLQVLDPEEENEKVQPDISKLINDIEMEELMEYVSSQPSDKKVTTPKQVIKGKIHATPSELFNDEEESDSSKPDPAKGKLLNSNETGEIEDNSSKENNLNELDQLIDLLKMIDTNDKKHENAVRLNIAKLATQNTSGILNMFSNGDLMNMLNEAVADATKNNQ